MCLEFKCAAMSFKALSTCIILFCWLIYTTDSVSFYGESYVHIPVQDEIQETNIELRFKTSRPYGTLVLIDYVTDVFIVQLHHGTIQLKTGSGSQYLLDNDNKRLDDLDWHTVSIKSKQDTVYLSLDNQDAVDVGTEMMAGLKHVSVYSVYLGGVDTTMVDKFDHELKGFRGAFSYVIINSKDMLDMARKLLDPSQIVEVSWDIDTIFDTSRSAKIQLNSETSFISFSHLHPSTDRTLSLQIKTEASNAIVAYSNIQHTSSRHYFSLEILQGHLQLTVVKSAESLIVSSETALSDGGWHQIDLQMDSERVELVIDDEKVSKPFGERSGAVYGGVLYIGGVNQKARAQALSDGLQALEGENSMKGGLMGCVNEIIVNGRAYNIHDIHASRMIGTGCEGEDTQCETSECEETVKEEDLRPRSDSGTNQLQFLAVHPVHVDEGGRTSITKENIEILYNYKEYGLRDSWIIISVKGKPKYGEIEVNLGHRSKNDQFTYLDLLGNKVFYHHSGKEQVYNEVEMEIEVINWYSVKNMPNELQQRYEFVLPINIKPTNDPPRIIMGNNGYLTIIQNTKIRITNEILKADDPDTPPNQLIYLIIEPPNQGYFEKVGKIGVPILEFTQAEIEDRQIWFLHLGSGDARVRMKLSDGKASSEPSVLHIQTVQLHLTVVKKTGLVMPHGTFGIIYSNNLTTTSNVPSQELEIRYDILRSPRHGVIERQQYTDGEWHETRTFAQRHIDLGHVRYRHTDNTQSPSSDQFSFLVKAKSYSTPYYYFRIQFEEVYLSLVVNIKLTVLHQSFGVITPDNLKARTNNPQLSPSLIKYTIMRSPSLGNIYRVRGRTQGHIDFGRSQKLTKDDRFTQEDINNGHIYYKQKSSYFERVQDFTDLRVYTVGTTAKILRFYIEFIPMKSDIRFINKGLKDVIEGRHKAIDKHSLFIQTDNYSVFEFSIISPLQHGQLQIVDPRSSAVLKTNVMEFSNEDIKDERLVYKHDDSEHDIDSFTFTAVPVIQRTVLAQSEIPEFTGTFEIQMLMRNDNPPVRAVDKVFKVVRNKKRVISIDDLAFSDPDIDYDPVELLYTRRGIPNGYIVHAENDSQIYTFHQQDIIDRNVVFHHQGDDFGRAAIYVTDGQFYTNALFEIEAGDPYIAIIKNTGAMVSSMGQIVITPQNLSVETNVDADDSDIRIVVIEGPKQGHILLDGERSHEFTVKDLKANKVEYKHETGSKLEDKFRFAVQAAGEAQTQSTFQIQILLGSVQLPPRVVNNRVLEVVEGSRPSTIEQKHLLIVHPESSEENIEYLVLVLPKHGKLYRDGNELKVDNDMTFTQLDINNGLVTYELENTTATTDMFIYEVSNGYEALRGLEFLIKIVQSSVNFETSNLTVEEGGMKALSSSNLRISDTFLGTQDSLSFVIKSKPGHGVIEMKGNPGVEILTFSVDDLENSEVVYVHDDSETLYDEFSVRVESEDGSMESDTRTVYVTVVGRNDEAPTIVYNKGLSVWRGSITQLTSNILQAHDPDNSPEELVYRVSSPSNGYLSVLSNTFKPISVFTQSMINDGQVVFVHKGENSGQFSFQVSDGHTSSELTMFQVTAKQLVLFLDVNQLLHAYPNTTQPISSNHLTASTNDPEQTKPIIFTLTSKPRHGRVVTMVNGRLQEVTSFTQEDVNASEIFYKHEDRLVGWTLNDSIEFNVSTVYAESLPGQRLEIQISYGNLNAENKNQLIRTSAIRVDEGGEMIVTNKNLDVSEFVKNLERLGKRVSLRFSLKDSPQHGVLMFKGRHLIKRTRFSQRNINNHELIYSHDDTNTVIDSFNLTLHLRIEGQSLLEGDDKETTFDLVLNVTIQPVNDEPFRLVTLNPAVRLIQGFSTPINKSILNTVDNDTAPPYITYQIKRHAENGHLAFKEDKWHRIERFSQQDINDERIIFVQDGSDESSAFYFQVSDGAFTPAYSSFNLFVDKVNMSLVANKTLVITQSDTSTVLTQDNLNVSTNGLRENITYIIVQKPKFGKIYLTAHEVFSFTQKDIDDHKVRYVQHEMESGTDSFICDIRYKIGDSGFSGIVLNVTTEPLVTIGPLVATRGERVALTLLNLDASKLTEKTADNPVYTITSGPYFGKIMKRAFSKRQVSSRYYRGDTSGNRGVTEFSHEDIVYMKVFYESNLSPYAVTDGADNFTFVLNAFNVQPAEGFFLIRLSPSDRLPVIPLTENPVTALEPVTKSILTLPSGEVDKENGDNSAINDKAIEPSSVKPDHVILLSILIPVLLLLIVIIIIVFFVWRRSRKREYAPSSKKSPRLRPHISGPYAVEQPHVHIEPQELESQNDDEVKSLVEYENTMSIPGASGRSSEETDIVTPMMAPPGYLRDFTHVPRSPDTSRTEVSATIPFCKVTPLIKNDISDEDQSGDDDTRKSTGSMGDMMDWITSDPELLQHCSSSTPPLLRKNQYWV